MEHTCIRQLDPHQKLLQPSLERAKKKNMLVTKVVLKYALFYDMLSVPGFYFQGQEIIIIICTGINYIKMMNKLSSSTRLSDKNIFKGWRGGSVPQSTGCSSRGPRVPGQPGIHDKAYLKQSQVQLCRGKWKDIFAILRSAMHILH